MIEMHITTLQWMAIIASAGFIVAVIDILNREFPGDQEFEDTEFPNEEDE